MRTAKRLLASVLLLLAFLAQSASAREVITKYDVSIKIDRDSSMTVTENITAAVENREINRGIIRVFPVKYTDKNGRTVHVGFEVLDVRIDGKKAGTDVTSSGRYREVRIGDPDRVLSRGLHTFTITYKTTRQLGFFENHDELYWNVTGNDWIFPILSASCRVALPGKGFGEGFNTVEWYTGAYGEKGDPRDAALTADGTVVTTRALNTYEGLTVVFTWPKGLVAPPPPLKGENAAAMAAIGAAVLLLILFCVWRALGKWGKSAAAGAVIPLFYPPDGITPGSAHYIYNGFKTDMSSFAADLLGLAVKGAIQIREEKADGIFGKGVITLEKNDRPKENLLPVEEDILARLFPKGSDNTLTLGEYNRRDYKRLANARGALWGFLRGMSFDLLREKTYALWPAAIIYILGVAALYLFSGDYFPVTLAVCAAAGAAITIIGSGGGDIRRSRSGVLLRFLPGLAPAAVMAAVFAWVIQAQTLPDVSSVPVVSWILRSADSVAFMLIAPFIALFAFAAITGIHSKNDWRSKLFGLAVRMGLAAAAGAALGSAASLAAKAFGGPLPPVLFMIAAGAASAARPLMTTLTQKGSDMIDGVDGLRLYMVTAEKSRLEMFNPPQETPELFERLLPYAFALDAAKTWADRFEKILADAHYEPTWYVGPSPRLFMTGNGFSSFSSNLQSQMTSSMRTPSSSPGSSSGSGGGGFSGGGGGGGGGRGW